MLSHAFCRSVRARETALVIDSAHFHSPRQRKRQSKLQTLIKIHTRVISSEIDCVYMRTCMCLCGI